jgi:hypothetical protein
VPSIPCLLADVVEQLAGVWIFAAAKVQGEERELGEVFVDAARSAPPKHAEIGINACFMQRQNDAAAPPTWHDHERSGAFRNPRLELSLVGSKLPATEETTK